VYELVENIWFIAVLNQAEDLEEDLGREAEE
jgi:hypothetical protein